MSINDYIAYLSEMNHIYTPLIVNNPIYNNRPQMYVYLRDRMGAETLEDALIILQRRRVSDRIVELWINEGLFEGTCYEAIKIGYPELLPQLEKILNKRRDRMWRE